MTPLLLDINEVAAALGVGRRTAYELRTRGDFPKPVTLSARIVRYRASDVQAFVERLLADPAPAPEPGQLAAGKARRRGSVGGSAGGLRGGSATRTAGKAQPARALAERLSVERKAATPE